MSYKRVLLREDLYKCAQCGYCNIVCPIYNQIPWESYSPRGKIFILKRSLEGEHKEIRSELSKRILQCTLCMRCEVECMLNLKLSELWKEVRGEYYAHQLFPKELYTYVDRLKKSRNALGMPPIASWSNKYKHLGVNREADVGYFVGCLASYIPQLQHIPVSLVSLLEKVGVRYTVLGDEWCCGTPLFHLGDVEDAREFAEHNIREFEKLGVQKVVVTCAGCYRALKVEYPKILKEKLPFEVLHSSEFLLELIEENKIQFTNLELKVAWHDPCELGRGAGVYEAPRKVIESIPGVRLFELENNRENSKCCGGGGMLPVTNPPLSNSIAKERVDEAIPLNLDFIVTGCSTCLLNLGGAAKKLGDRVKVIDLVELVSKALV